MVTRLYHSDYLVGGPGSPGEGPPGLPGESSLVPPDLPGVGPPGP